MLNNLEAKVLAIFNEQLEDLLPESETGIDTKFEEMGLNSITFIKFIVELEKEFDFQFEHEELDINEYETLREIIQVIQEKTNVQGKSKIGGVTSLFKKNK